MPFILLFALFIITIFGVDSPKLYKAVYAVSNFALLALTFISFIFYSKAFEISPWYSPHDIPFLVIIYLTIWVVVIEGVTFILSKKIHIPKTSLYVPILAAVVLGLNALFDYKSPIMHIAGALASLSIFITLAILFIKNFEKTFRK